MDMPQIGVFHRLMQTLASDDSRDGIEHGNSRDNERHQHDHEALRPNDAHHRHDADDQPDREPAGDGEQHVVLGPREVIVAEAYRDAQKVKGEGDAKAAAIYAQAFGQNPEFYAFYRSLEAYRNSFKNKGDVIVVEPNSDFFKYMKSLGRGEKAAK